MGQAGLEGARAGHRGKEKEPLGSVAVAESQQILVCYHHTNEGWLQFKQENNF